MPNAPAAQPTPSPTASVLPPPLIAVAPPPSATAIAISTPKPKPTTAPKPSPTSAPAPIPTRVSTSILTPTSTSAPTPIPKRIPTPAPTPTHTPTAAPSSASPVVIIGGVAFDAEIADTPELRGKGLGERDSLASQSGMLFVFPDGHATSFWMKGMRFPLDFVWIGADCRVADITERVSHAEPGASDSALLLYNSAAPAAYTFEINAGEVQRLGIRIGDAVRFRGIRSEFAKC